VSEHDLIALYGGTRLFVYPSRLEGFGLPVLEAMSCGAPVVASDVAAIREVAGDAAWLVPPGDVPGLVTAISRTLSEADRVELMRELGFARARRFSWTRTAEHLWKLGHEVGPSRESSDPDRSVEPGRPAFSSALSSSSALPSPSSLASSSPPLLQPFSLSPAPPRSPSLPSPSVAPPPVGSPPAGLRPVEWALLAAVTYADLFDAPLPIEEAQASCMGAAVDAAQIRELVCHPVLGRYVTMHANGDLVRTGRDELVARRQDGVARTAALLQSYRPILDFLATLPFVRMLAYSGGTAHQNPGRKPDIDLFVVTAPGSLYTAYTLIFLLTKLTHTRSVVCPNYLVDESQLLIVYHRDLFTANQVVSARPLSGPDTYAAFCAANESWVHGYFPGFRPRTGAPLFGRPALQRAAEIVFRVGLGPIERTLRSAWRFHIGRRAAQARHPDVVLADGILKLHLSDYRRRVLARFSERLDTLRIDLAERESDASVPERRAVRS
jgi:hypothetical protein